MPTFVHNKKAHFDYEMLQKFEAGIELLGHEVKSVKNSHGSLDGARVLVRGGEAFLVGCTIPLYQPNNAVTAYQIDRTRKLLLTKKEIAELAGAEGQKGLTIIPVSMYQKGKKVKIEIAIVKGKKKYDKREVIKKRDTERDLAREYSAR
jgi:SsrA-binding protein